MANSNHDQSMSYDTKVIITVLTLLFAYPIGVILMWLWTKWNTWVKVLLTSVLLIIPLIAVLLAITLIAVNPTKQFSQANNTKRTSDVNIIENAVSQYKADHNNLLPSSITATAMPISSTGVNLCKDLTPQYIAALPKDPLVDSGNPVNDCSISYDTGYTISVDAAGKITVSAPQAELQETISVSR